MPPGTPSHKKVLTAFVRHNGRTYGSEIAEESGLEPGTVYRTLRQLKRDGWVVDSFGYPEHTTDLHKLRRQYYQLTSNGKIYAQRLGVDVNDLKLDTWFHQDGSPCQKGEGCDGKCARHGELAEINRLNAELERMQRREANQLQQIARMEKTVSLRREVQVRGSKAVKAINTTLEALENVAVAIDEYSAFLDAMASLPASGDAAETLEEP